MPFVPEILRCIFADTTCKKLPAPPTHPEKGTSARAPSWRRWGAEPLPVRLRAGIRLALSAGGKAPGEPGWSPARREWGALRAQLSHRAPQAPAPGSHPRSRRLDWFQRPEAEPSLNGEGSGARNGRLKEARASLGPAPVSRSRRLETEQSSRATGVLSSPGQPPKCSVLYNTPTSLASYEPMSFTCTLIIKPPNNPIR